MQYVTHYEGTAYYVSGGSSNTKLYPFLEEHALEARSFLDEKGLPLAAAQRLIDKWNDLGKHNTSIRYSYRLP